MKEHDFTPKDIARITSYNPGKFVNKFLVDQPKMGKFKIGYPGSFTILDLNKSTTVQRNNIKSKAGWSPFENITFPISIDMVIINGKIMNH